MAPSIKGALIKGSLVGVVGAVGSVLVLGGLEGAPILTGMYLPKAVIHGVVLAGSSVGATFLVPHLVPFVSAGSPQLKRFESVILEPLVLGGVFMAVESLLAPAATVQGAGGALKQIMVGTGASVGASYVSEGMGWVETVLG